MGNGPSGNTMQTSNSSSNSTSGPNPYIAPMLKNLTGSAYDWMGGNMTAPAYFPGGTVGPQSERTGVANNALWQRGAAGAISPGRLAAGSMVADTLGGKYLDPASNPAYQGWLDASFRPQAEQFRDILAPSIDSTFAGSGRTGGGAHFDTMMRGVQDLERAQSDAAAKAGLGMYQGERANQFNALGYLPTAQAMDYQDIAAMAQAGRPTDIYAQRMLDDQNAKYGYDSTAQLDWYNRLAQTLLGMYPGGQTSSTGTSSGTSYGGGGGGGVGSFLGPGLQLAGMALPFIPGFGLSDERLKKNIRPVGETYTGHKLYAYEFLGSDKPEIGVIAQEVEQTDPEAVALHPSGYRMVNYDHVTAIPKGGLL